MFLGKRLRRLCLSVLGTTVLGFGGCLEIDLSRIIRFGAAYGAAEFLLDNDTSPLGVFGEVFGDVFGDGA